MVHLSAMRSSHRDSSTVQTEHTSQQQQQYKYILVRTYKTQSTVVSVLFVEIQRRLNVIIKKKKIMRFRHFLLSFSPYSLVCVCFLPIYSGRQVCRRTSRGHTGRSHRIYLRPSFCGACLNFSREKDSAVSFPRRP